MNTTQIIKKEGTFLTGIGLVIASLGIFAFPDWLNVNQRLNSDMGIFFLNYLIFILYSAIAYIREVPSFRMKHFQEKAEFGFIVLILGLISAYSLNREIPVFERSTDWLQFFLVIQGCILLFTKYLSKSNNIIRILYWISLGIIFSYYLYLSIYLIPIYPVGIVASIALGISLHAFIPLGFVLSLILFLLRKDNFTRSNLFGFGTGILVSLLVVIIYTVSWNQLDQKITRAMDKSILNEKNDLPEWVIIGKNLPQNTLTEKILKTDLVYSTASENRDLFFFNLPSNSFDEVKKHDPFIMMATYFLGKPKLSNEQKIHILESMFDSRHKAQQRLWSGDNLETSHVVTDVRLYPNLRIGYTEKYITIRNNMPKSSISQQQEAIYTFHLPEGGTVTSLSLWINGKEENAILTTKNKADSAYRTIVGVEQRDPSIVRWQEGNTVSVRVFPCTPETDRRFKIGITAPLRKTENRLFYDNIWFDGPSATEADESVQVKTMDNIKNPVYSADFTESEPDKWLYEGRYLSSWSLNFQMIPIQPNRFHFDGDTYSISNYEKKYQNYHFQNLYLDINKNWTKDEFNQILKMAGTKKIFVCTNQSIELNNENSARFFDILSTENFSIFPFYLIKDPQNSLVITKGISASPNISDLGDCEFTVKLRKYITQSGKINVFNLNQETSPYIKTLRELRTFNYDFGTLNDLSDIIKAGKFVVNEESPYTVVIYDAGIKISINKDTSSVSNAPDHLMRLFTYNNVMQQIGTNYFTDSYNDSSIVNNAHKAYVVSPLTSLVVLETQKDYKNFNIHDNGTSLKNASMKSAGAVPEPHEWLLIIVLIGLSVYLFLKGKVKLSLKTHQNNP